MKKAILFSFFVLVSLLSHAQSWQMVGDPGVLSGYGGKNFSKLYYDPQHSLHIAFSPGSGSNRVVDLQWNGTTWDVVFDHELPNTVSGMDVEVDSKGNYYMVYGFIKNTYNQMSRIKVFKPGVGWSFLSDSVSIQAISNVDIELSPKDSLFFNAGNKVFKYNANGIRKEITPGSNFGILSNAPKEGSMFFDKNGALNVFNNAFSLSTFKYDGLVLKYENATWTQVGGKVQGLTFYFATQNKDNSLMIGGNLLTGSFSRIYGLNGTTVDTLFTTKTLLVAYFAASNQNSIYATGAGIGGTVYEQTKQQTYKLDTLTVAGTLLQITGVAVDTSKSNEVYVAVTHLINLSSVVSVFKFTGSKTAVTGLDNVVTAPASFKVYPNPATNRIAISGFSSIDQMELYDANGRLVKNWKSPSNDIALEEVNKGIYYLKLYSENNKYSTKLVVE